MHTEGTQAEVSWGVGKGRELIRERELWTKRVASKRAVEKLQGRELVETEKDAKCPRLRLNMEGRKRLV